MRHHLIRGGIVAFLFGIGIVTGYAIQPSQSDEVDAAFAEWHEPCLFYIAAYSQLLAVGGDDDLRPAWQPEDEYYARWRMEGEWLYLEKDNGKYGIERASVISSIRWTTGEACGNLRLEEKP